MPSVKAVVTVPLCEVGGGVFAGEIRLCIIRSIAQRIAHDLHHDTLAKVDTGTEAHDSVDPESFEFVALAAAQPVPNARGFSCPCDPFVSVHLNDGVGRGSVVTVVAGERLWLRNRHGNRFHGGNFHKGGATALRRRF